MKTIYNLIFIINALLILSSCKDQPGQSVVVGEAVGQTEGNYTIVKSYKISDINPVGISVLDNKIFVTDTTQKIVLQYNIEHDVLDTIANDLQVCYINQRMSKIIMPVYNKDSVFVYRGDPNYYKFQLPIKLNNPTCFDGLNVNNFALVDQSNHRLIINKEGEFSIVGQYGSGEEQLDTPTAVCLHSNKYYVVDSGNKKIKIFDTTGKYLDNFGEEDDLISPTGISSDRINLYVADAGKNQVLVYNGLGMLQDSITQIVSQPSDVYAFNSLIYVCNKEGQTISIIKRKM